MWPMPIAQKDRTTAIAALGFRPGFGFAGGAGGANDASGGAYGEGGGEGLMTSRATLHQRLRAWRLRSDGPCSLAAADAQRDDGRHRGRGRRDREDGAKPAALRHGTGD